VCVLCTVLCAICSGCGHADSVYTLFQGQCHAPVYEKVLHAARLSIGNGGNPADPGNKQLLELASPSDSLFVQHQIRCYQKGYTHPVPLVGWWGGAAPGVRALPIKFEDWEDASSIARTIGNAKLSFDDLVVDDGQVMLTFRDPRTAPLVLQLDDSDQGLGKYMFDLQWPPSAKEWCDEVKRVPCDDLWEEQEQEVE
jgi:hypothetical protein